ncbi:MAG: hypothetical protein ACR2NZ_13215 [Rubripirellula sp.]
MDTDKIKDFLLYNFEKMILVVVILAAGYLIYAGTAKPIFTADNDPDRLETQAKQVRSDIDIDHNENIIPERIPTFDILAATEVTKKPIDISPYKPPQIWGPQGPDGQRIQRQDPLLLPPSDLRLASVATVIAIREDKRNPGYALADLEDADPVEKVVKKVRRPRRPRRNMMDEMGMDMEEGMESEMDMDMMMGGMDMSMMEGMEGSMSAGSGRRLDSKFDFGYRPKATEDGREPIPSVGRFIAGTAVVPHKELYEAYELALRDNDQYDPRRDTPFYYDLEVQRADVTEKPVDQLVEADWVKLPWNRDLYTQLGALRWSGFAPEIVPGDYRDEALTTWIPPVLLDDYRPFATHPMIPMVPHKELKAQLGIDTIEDDPMEFSIDGAEGLDLVVPGERGGGLSGGGGYEMDMDMGMDMEEGMDGMMMGMGMAMMGRSIEADPVDYKLIRFYDFAGFKSSPKKGHNYVYRIRYAVNDPNFPFLQTLQPKISSLAPEAEKRVQTLMAQAKKSNSRKNLFKRWSDWSQPSAPAALPDLEQYFVGPVKRGTVNTWSVGGKEVGYSREQPKAKMIASQFDPTTGARIPMTLDVFEGTVLSKKMETADVIDPITLSVKKLPEAEILSATTVVDIDGGVPLKITEELSEPGMMLLFDQDGRLHLNDEVGDQESYRIYSFADERGE